MNIQFTRLTVLNQSSVIMPKFINKTTREIPKLLLLCRCQEIKISNQTEPIIFWTNIIPTRKRGDYKIHYCETFNTSLAFLKI